MPNLIIRFGTCKVRRLNRALLRFSITCGLFKAQPTNAFFATVNQMFGGSSQLPTVLSELYSTIWFDYRALGSSRNAVVRMLLKSAVSRRCFLSTRTRIGRFHSRDENHSNRCYASILVYQNGEQTVKCRFLWMIVGCGGKMQKWTGQRSLLRKDPFHNNKSR